MRVQAYLKAEGKSRAQKAMTMQQRDAHHTYLDYDHGTCGQALPASEETQHNKKKTASGINITSTVILRRSSVRFLLRHHSSSDAAAACTLFVFPARPQPNAVTGHSKCAETAACSVEFPLIHRACDAAHQVGKEDTENRAKMPRCTQAQLQLRDSP